MVQVMVKTEIVTARVEPWIKELIKNKGMTVREALEYVAMILASPIELTKAEIKKIENEIDQLHLEHERTMHKIDEIQTIILLKEKVLDELKQRLEDSGEINPAYEQMKPAIEVIFNAAERFNCHPLDINKYTARDIIGFQAQKCGVPKAFLKDYLDQNWDPN